MATARDDGELDVNAAARASGRTAETIRRWVWSGRLAARKSGNRLWVKRSDVEHLAGATESALSLGEWMTLAEKELRRHPGPRRSAADLVIEDRRRRHEELSDRGR